MFDGFSAKVLALEEKNQALMARLYVILGTISIINAQAMIKQSDVPIPQIMYQRGLLIVVSNVWLFSKKPSQEDPSKEFYIRPISKLKMCALSTFLLAIQVPFFFLSQKMIPIGESMVLASSNTMWGQFIALYLFNETLTWSRIRNILLSFVGLIMIVRPPFIFGSSEESDSKHFLGSLIMICCAVCQACSYSLVKKVGSKISPNVQATYFHFETMILGGLIVLIDEIKIHPFTIDYLWKLLVIAFFSYICHVLTYRAFSLYSFAKLAPLQFLGVIYGILIDMVVFQTFPGILSIIGCLIVLGSVIAGAQEIID